MEEAETAYGAAQTLAVRAVAGAVKASHDTLILLPARARGSSGASVSFVRDSACGRTYAVKSAVRGRVSLQTECRRRESIRPYLAERLPDILWCGEIDGHEVLVSDCPTTRTLGSRVADLTTDDGVLQEIWTTFLDEIARMWSLSRSQYRSEGQVRPFPQRLVRIREGLKACLSDCLPDRDVLDLPLVVNEESFPPLRRNFEAVAAAGTPSYGVTCHGDPQASNLLVTDQGGWYLIDWEWSGGQHDWRMMFSHLHGWWATRFLRNRRVPTWNVTGGRLHLEYDTYLPRRPFRYQSSALSIFAWQGPGRRGADVLDANLFLAALYLGQIRFLPRRLRHLAVPLIGEAVRIIDRVGRPDQKGGNAGFGIVA